MKDKTIYSIIRHVSQSGMTRHISFHYIEDGRMYSMNHLIAEATGFKFNKNYDSLVVKGCGMDMAFHVVEHYSRATGKEGNYYRSQIL